MNNADLQSLSGGLSGFVTDLQNSTTQAEKGAVINNIARLSSVVSNEEKRINDAEFRNEQFALNKDHTYFQEKIEENKFKEQVKDNSEKNELEKKKFEQQIKDNSEKNKLEEAKLKQQISNDKFRNDLDNKKFEQQLSSENEKNEIEKLKLELEKDRLDIQRKELEQKAKDARNDTRFKWITFGITTTMGLLTAIMPILVYRKLAYTNLKLIYKDEGRPTTEYKDAIKSVQNLIKKH
jgi:DNA polymerase III alpha subunit (gram-positive type)